MANCWERFARNIKEAGSRSHVRSIWPWHEVTTYSMYGHDTVVEYGGVRSDSDTTEQLARKYLRSVCYYKDEPEDLIIPQRS